MIMRVRHLLRPVADEEYIDAIDGTSYQLVSREDGQELIDTSRQRVADLTHIQYESVLNLTVKELEQTSAMHWRNIHNFHVDLTATPPWAQFKCNCGQGCGYLTVEKHSDNDITVTTGGRLGCNIRVNAEDLVRAIHLLMEEAK